MNYMYLYNLNYSYRIRTEATFENRKPYFFDLFFVNDHIFDQHFLFQNLWRETILLNNFDDKRVQKFISFGQLPDNVIYRGIDEIQGMTLQEYIDNKLIEWHQIQQRAKDEDLRVFSIDELKAQAIREYAGGNIENPREEPEIASRHDSPARNKEHDTSLNLKGNASTDKANYNSSKRTLFSEYEAITIII